MTPSLGQKRNKIDLEQIDEIVRIYENYEENEYSKIFDNEDFGYTRIIIERPLRKNFQVTESRIERLKQKQEFKKLSEPTAKLLQPRQDDVISVLKTIDSMVFMKT